MIRSSIWNSPLQEANGACPLGRISFTPRRDQLSTAPVEAEQKFRDYALDTVDAEVYPTTQMRYTVSNSSETVMRTTDAPQQLCIQTQITGRSVCLTSTYVLTSMAAASAAMSGENT
jgi:hypothetical protein